MNRKSAVECVVGIDKKKIVGWGQNLVDCDATGLVDCRLLILVASKTIKRLPNDNLQFVKSLQETIFFLFSPESVRVEVVAVLVERLGRTKTCNTVDGTLAGSSRGPASKSHFRFFIVYGVFV